ncbi:sensor histidine kinase [Nesterenkonia alkaliphila]|uniref:histidine kinase n=1 Tax=Nesterenkonia alkaliphila TaxID=1463631 RepID=A0A7K1UKM9_9MICC|nr:HAMP domain-containing sensor histidine kinase [Nesterenkonia alkaliphila]MVT27048.1 HAMP domain-containing protein [Nesterenkonia alkaliphila]GFZ93885.1 putative sensor histidine kinase [Nesterenkonia alkaliphila]
MASQPKWGWKLGTRLLAASALVLMVGAGAAWLVAFLTGQAIFHDHMLMAEATDPPVVAHAQEAFESAWTLSLSLALAAAFIASVVISFFLARRMGRTLNRIRQAAVHVAEGDYAARVPEGSMGAEFAELAAAFNQMAGKLDHVEQTRKRLLSDLAHEMRTPLATVDGYLEAITDGVAQPDASTLAMLRDQVHRLSRLARDISLVSTAEEGTLSMHHTHLTVGEILESAITQARNKNPSGSVSLQSEADETTKGLVLSCDKDRIGQVMTNLLDNAFQHTPEAGQVTLRVTRAGAFVRIEVKDTGDGIAAEHLPHVFERFYRVDTARDRAHGGSGIGLAIVRSIIKAHGGTVDVQSEGPGQGTTFSIELPIASSSR